MKNAKPDQVGVIVGNGTSTASFPAYGPCTRKEAEDLMRRLKRKYGHGIQKTGASEWSVTWRDFLGRHIGVTDYEFIIPATLGQLKNEVDFARS